MNYCKCGCGQECRFNYRRGHIFRVNNPMKDKETAKKSALSKTGKRRLDMIGNKIRFGKKSHRKGISMELEYGIEGLKQLKNKISENTILVLSSLEKKLKMSNSAKNRKYKDFELFKENCRKVSIETWKNPILRKKQREKMLQRIQDKYNQNLPLNPMMGKYETAILDRIELNFNKKIERQYYVDGYWIDGYIPELKLAIEIDEEHHFDKSGIFVKRDVERQKYIEEKLGCEFLRIKSEAIQ